MKVAGARKIAASSAILLAENFVRLLAVVAVSFWIARKLGPGQFGILNFASAFMSILLALAAMGMDTPMILRLTQTEKPGALLGTALLIRSVAGGAALAIAIVIAYLLKHDDPIALQVTLIVSLGIIAGSFSPVDFWFKANTSPTGPAIARTSATLLSICAKVAFLLLGMGVIALAWTVTLEAVLSSLGLLLAYKWATKNALKDKLSVDVRQIRPLLKESLPYLVSGVAIILYMKVDVVMLGYLSSNKETGIYSLAQKLSEVLYVVPVVLIDSAYPTLARKFLDSDSNDGSHGQLLFDIAVGGSMVAIVVSLLLVGPAIEIIFGTEYLESIGIFQIHAWSCIAIAMNTARYRWLATVNLQKFIPYVTALGLIVNVALNMVLIPGYGAKGAAVATVVSYFLSGYFSSFFITELRPMGMVQTRSLWPWFRLVNSMKLRMQHDSR